MTEMNDPFALKALLDWQAELGADDAIGDAPVNRYDQPVKPPAQTAPAQGAETRFAQPDAIDPVAEARALAGAAQNLEDLRAALAAYPHCDLRHGARNLVFADGQPGARVMILGEAPGREEDAQGLPFVGPAGQLLDRMLAAIGLSRTAPDPGRAVYITNILPWRPPQNRTPTPAEIAMLMPFVARHVALAQPDFLVLMGNAACQGVLSRTGITKLRGDWTAALGLPCLPMFHPAYLLRNPQAKREAWADLLSLKSRMTEADQ